MFENKEQLANYLISGNVHLSKKDYSFFNNIRYSTHEGKSVTSNQDILFNKLILKYQKQLKKLGHDVNTLITIPWKNLILKSDPTYSQAKLSLENGKLEIKSPFNTKFIQNFRKLSYNEFVWLKNKRVYEAPFSTFNLKIANQYLKLYYKDVSYCDKIEALFNEIKEYDTCKYWNPTLVKVGDHYYVHALTESLYEVLKNITLSNDPNTLYLLSQHGVTIHPNITKGDEFLSFASEYNTKVNIDDFAKVAGWLKQLNIKHVFLSRMLNVYNQTIGVEVKEILKKMNIESINNNEKDIKEITCINLSSSLPIHFDSENFQVSKYITIVNSRPVHVK